MMGSGVRIPLAAPNFVGQPVVVLTTDTDNWNSILNLSHLDANENQSKTDTPLAKWTEEEAKRQKVSPSKFCSDHLLPEMDVLNFSQFPKFIQERRNILGDRLRQLLQ